MGMGICKIKRITHLDYWWVDGSCGFQISSGHSIEEAVLGAIEYINNDAANSAVQKVLYDNRNVEVFYLCGEYWAFKQSEEESDALVPGLEDIIAGLENEISVLTATLQRVLGDNCNLRQELQYFKRNMTTYF